jgi:hypothetical protein
MVISAGPLKASALFSFVCRDIFARLLSIVQITGVSIGGNRHKMYYAFNNANSSNVLSSNVISMTNVFRLY